MEVPQIKKIVVNMGLGEAIQNVKILDSATAELELQLPDRNLLLPKQKNQLQHLNFVRVCRLVVWLLLRRDRMYEFLDRLMNVSLARVRDFKGVSGKAFDGKGNYTLGIKEQLIFPEINYDTVDKIKGMNITIVTSAKTDEEGKALLKYLGMPFRN